MRQKDDTYWLRFDDVCQNMCQKLSPSLHHTSSPLCRFCRRLTESHAPLSRSHLFNFLLIVVIMKIIWLTTLRDLLLKRKRILGNSSSKDSNELKYKTNFSRQLPPPPSIIHHVGRQMPNRSCSKNLEEYKQNKAI